MRHLPRNQVLQGDALALLRRLPTSSVDCVITSPPYFALRDYQTQGQIGLERNVGEWVTHIVMVGDGLARVLKPQGSLWINLGDSYARHPSQGATPKSLLLAPERVVLALSARGWILRNKVIWAKSNPMPTSVRDRLSCTWEPLYLLVRSPNYFFDLDAIRIPHRTRRSASTRPFVPNPRPDWAGPLAGSNSGLDRLKAAGIPGHPLGKNPGDVWTIAKSSRRDGHYATFPEALVRRPLLATCPERVCKTCGQAWRRQPVSRALGRLALIGHLEPVCNCRAPARPGVVLDPFLGSGTTAVVAARHGRDWIGIELSPHFCEIAERRIREGQSQKARAA